MAVNGIGASGPIRSAVLSRSVDAAAEDNHYALVPVQEASFGRSLGSHSRLTSATFLAQLIATEQGEPQTREKRRATPDVAAQAYAAGSRLDGANSRKN